MKRSGSRAHVAPILCRDANRLPAATSPIEDCHPAAKLQPAIPAGVKPRHGRSTMATATRTIKTAMTMLAFYRSHNPTSFSRNTKL